MAFDANDYTDKVLGALGLRKLANIINNHVHKKAELQEDIEVKNPRVSVQGWGNGTTISHTEFKTLDDVMNYMFRNVIAEAQPTLSAILPTMTITLDVTSSSAEVGTQVTITPKFSTFNEGSIGTCIEPWEEEPHQSRVASGSTKSGTAKFASKGKNGTIDPSVYSENISETITLANGNNFSEHYVGRIGYTESTAKSYTSYGKEATKNTGVTYFAAGTTANSAVARSTIVGYFPSFGNISRTDSSKKYSSTITNLGNTLNGVSNNVEFYVGNIKTSVGNNIQIYVKDTLTINGKLAHWDAIGQKWVDEDTSTESGYYATIPAGTTTANFPKKFAEGEDVSGKTAYKKIYLTSTAMELGAAKWRISLKSV